MVVATLARAFKQVMFLTNLQLSYFMHSTADSVGSREVSDDGRNYLRYQKKVNGLPRVWTWWNFFAFLTKRKTIGAHPTL